MKFLGLAVLNVHKIIKEGLPWWLGGEESACPCRRHGSDFWSGKIPQAVAQWSLCRTNEHALWTTRDPKLLKPVHLRAHAPQRKKLLQREARALQPESSPALGNHRQACTQRQRHSTSHKHTNQEQIYNSQKQLFPITHKLFSQISRNRWAYTRGRDIMSYVTVRPNNLDTLTYFSYRCYHAIYS